MPKFKFPLDPESNSVLCDVLFFSKKGDAIKLTMALDTGASLTTLPHEAAMAIGCDPTKSTKKMEIVTASGTEYVPVVTIPGVNVFGFTLKDVQAVCLNLPPRSSVSGLIGLNSLRRFNIFLKFLEDSLEVSQ